MASPMPRVEPVTMMVLFWKRMVLRVVAHARTYGMRTDLAIWPECIFSKASCHSSRGQVPPTRGATSRLPEASKAMIFSQIGQLCEKLPWRVTFFWTRGSREKSRGLRPQADLGDPSCGADEVDGGLEGSRDSGGVDDGVSTETVAAHGPVRGVVDEGSGTVLFGDVETGPILFEAENGNVGTGDASDGGAQDADGAGTDDEDAVAGLKVGVVDDGVVGDGAGLGEGGNPHVESVGNEVKAAGGNANKTGPGTIDTVTESFAGGEPRL